MPPPRRKQPRTPDLAALGKAVEHRRKELGLTLEQLGDRDFSDHKLAGEIERGQRDPHYSTLLRLAKVLETRPETLVAAARRFAKVSEKP